MSVTDQVGREIRVGSTCKVMWNDAGASEGVVGATGVVTKVARTRVHLRIEGWANDWVIGGRALSVIEEEPPTTTKDNSTMTTDGTGWDEIYERPIKTDIPTPTPREALDSDTRKALRRATRDSNAWEELSWACAGEIIEALDDHARMKAMHVRMKAADELSAERGALLTDLRLGRKIIVNGEFVNAPPVEQVADRSIRSGESKTTVVIDRAKPQSMTEDLDQGDIVFWDTNFDHGIRHLNQSGYITLAGDGRMKGTRYPGEPDPKVTAMSTRGVEVDLWGGDMINVRKLVLHKGGTYTLVPMIRALPEDMPEEAS